MSRFLPVAAGVLSILLAGGAAGQDSWDGLTRTKSSRFDAVYLLQGADFSGYTKIMLDPTEVAFEKNWLRDYNGATASFSGRMTDADAQQILNEARRGFEESFRNGLTAAGFTLTDTAGADVLRIRTGVVNLNVVAPDQLTAGRSRTFAREAGRATLIVEARDSLTGALLGRAVDTRLAGSGGQVTRNSVTNRNDFARLFNTWTKISVDGVVELKRRSPPAGSAAAR